MDGAYSGTFDFSKWIGSMTADIKGEVMCLLSQLPGPPGEFLPTGANESEILDVESALGFRMPPKYRDWLTACNGPCVGPGGIVGINTARTSQNLAKVLELHPAWKVNRWLPVAGDGFGSYFVVDASGDLGEGEPVIFVNVNESDSARAYIAASDTWKFLRFLFRKELGRSNWPYSRQEVLTDDPEIGCYSAVTCPWDA